MQGMGVLRQIEAKISCQVGAASLAELSSQFYTFIPHVTGMSAPPTIRDLEVVASKVELLMCLLDVTVAVRKMEASEQAVVHPLDHVYSSLDCSIQPLQPGPLLDTLRNYMVTPAICPGVSSSCLSFTLRQTTTHGETHQEWKLELQAAYIISRSEEEVRFEPHKHDRNRRLLWFDFPPPTPTLSRYLTCPAPPRQARQPHLQRDPLHPLNTSAFALRQFSRLLFPRPITRKCSSWAFFLRA